jgi:HK97 family phage major capsid protein
MKFLEVLRAKLAELSTQREAALAEMEAATAVAETEARATLNDAEAAAFAAARDKVNSVDAEIQATTERVAELVAIEERRALADLTPTAKPIIRKEAAHASEVRYMRPAEVRDNALRVLERDGKELAPFQLDHVNRTLRANTPDLDGSIVGRLMIATMDPDYRSAFAKIMTGNGQLVNSDEVRALQTVAEVRAASSTSAAGGYGIPVLIDPTIILTSGAADAPIVAISRVETITTNIWKGVSSAGVTWSTDGEGTAVSDDAPTVAQPSVTTYMGRGFIPFSVQIGMDYPGFEAEMSALLAQGYLDYLATKTATGSGSSDLKGIFTAIAAVGGSCVTVTTDGALGAVDFRKVWAALPERFRSRSTWVHSVSVDNQLRSFSPNGTGSEYLANLHDAVAGDLMRRPVAITDYAPAFTATTGAANITVVGDFSRFLIAQRAGMTVEYVPHLFDVTTNLPTSQRGWLAWSRVGCDAIDTGAFRLLQNT